MLRHPVREADHPARDDVQPRMGPELIALGEEELQAEADPEERPPFTDHPEERLDEPSLLQVPHAVGKGPDPRQDDLVRLQHDLRVGGHHRFAADPLEPLLDGAEVPHAVIDYCNHFKPL